MAGPGEWIRTHKTAAAVGGLGGAGALALYTRSRSKRSGGSSSSGLFGGSASPAPAVGGAFDSSAMDTYNALASAISSQNDQISKIQSELATNAVAAIPPSTGSGIVTPAQPAAPPPGSDYVEVSQQAALADVSHGVGVYQSGASALDFARQHGGSPLGIDTNAFYALNPTPQQVNLASGLGYPLYVKAH